MKKNQQKKKLEFNNFITEYIGGKMFQKVLIAAALILLVLTTAVNAQFVVTNTNDAGAGSLRDAINQANAAAGNNTITFNIGGGGLWTIFPLSQLPPLTDMNGVWINGLSQPGAATGAMPPSTATLMIEINGVNAGFAHGIWVQSDNNFIDGLIINTFEGDGIRVEGGLANPQAAMNMAFCNFIGTDPTGTIDMGNGTNPVSLWAGFHVCNVPGGIAIENAIDASLISGNWSEGVWIQGPFQPGDVGMNHITGNYIGTDITGTVDLGNDRDGICMTEGTHNNDAASNLVSGNDYSGIGIQGFNNVGFGAPILTFGNLVVDNTIGLDINMAPLPNTYHGVAIGIYGPTYWGCAIENYIEYNRIAFNGLDGVSVWEDGVDNNNCDYNRISQNSIYDNGGLGIDLNDDGVTLNDPGDPDFFANEELNFPVILTATFNAGTTTITGTIDIDTAPNLATVEVFKADVDPTGYGEGRTYLGSATPDAAGNWTFIDVTLVVGDTITATTTDVNNNTSEFCLNVPVTTAQCLICSTYTTTPIVPNVGGTIIWSLSVTNCGSAPINVYGEIYPTVGDCASGTRYDYNIRRNVVNNLPVGGVFTGYYWYIPGTVTGITTVALETGVGPAYENYLTYCCFDFQFSY
ncbi:MAG: hypothetical protein GY855_14770, partial [candidate division Zixibacteria bacterium]|nr:hypothetical protein [candidate division Zixibacteria bacterium]